MKLHKPRLAVLILIIFISLETHILPQRTLAAVKPAPDTKKNQAGPQSVIHVPSDTANLQEAINLVSDGGVIELANGTYIAPSSGFAIVDVGKSFTIRAATGANVILDGGGTRNILRFINSYSTSGKAVVFENIKFANGFSSVNGVAAGVSMQHAQATFINSVFINNKGVASDNSVGGIAVAIYSSALFINCQWSGNTSTHYGGGMGVIEFSKAYIHQSRFLNNRTNPPGHSSTAAGGAIDVRNSILRVSNSYFEGNQAGYVGGGIFAIGIWNGAMTDPQADILVVNSTFVNNQAIRDSSVSVSYPPTEGGAIHLEDQAFGRIYNSRFIENSADEGGGVNLYRSRLEIADTVFLGNFATGLGAGKGVGGAIASKSIDGIDLSTNYGTINRPPSYLTVRNSLIQGRYDGVTIIGQAGGGIYAAGDLYRQYGLGGVPKMGTLAENQAVVDIEHVVFNDLDVAEDPSTPGSGLGGAIVVDVANLTLNDSLIINSDAIGTGNSFGGAVAILEQSVARINNSTFAQNSSQKYGGAIFVQGSQLSLSNCNLVENSNATPYGSAIFAAQDDTRNLPVTGTVENCILSNNSLPMIYDDDRTNGPINDMHYSNNQFYHSSGVNAGVYQNSLTGAMTGASQLNNLIVSRNNGTTTDKGAGNIALASAPGVGAIFAVPSQILATTANGDATSPTLSYLGIAWSGGSATLNGQGLTGNTGVKSAGAGMYTLSVGGTNLMTSISQAPAPDVTFTASGSAPVTLNWNVSAGTFLDMAIDHGVAISPSSYGSVQVSPPADMDYWLYVIAEEGGIAKSVNSGVSIPILNVPSTINLLAGKNNSVNKGSFSIKNDGGGMLQWVATSQNSRLDHDRNAQWTNNYSRNDHLHPEHKLSRAWELCWYYFC